MKKVIYRQCGLVRDLGNDRTAGLVSYLPARFAKKNHIVKLKQDDGQWEDGWKVVSVGASVDADHTPIRIERVSVIETGPETAFADNAC